MKIVFPQAFAAVLSGWLLISGYANACGLRDNGATMTDPVTGIEIQKCQVGQTWTGNSCSGSATLMTFNQAVIRYGQGEWRLISKAEAENVLSRSKGCQGYTWTSSLHERVSGHAYNFNVYAAELGTDETSTYMNAVNLVRSSRSAGVGTMSLTTGSNQGGNPISGSSNSQSTTAPLNTSNQSQQLQGAVHQAEASARSVQRRADADAQRRGRRVHDPAAEAHDCLRVDPTGLFGAMVNTCSYKVWFNMCAYKPRDEKVLDSGWLVGLNCENQKFGLDSVGPNSRSAMHTKGAEAIHYFACKDPAMPADASFEGGNIAARCRNLGGN